MSHGILVVILMAGTAYRISPIDFCTKRLAGYKCYVITSLHFLNETNSHMRLPALLLTGVLTRLLLASLLIALIWTLLFWAMR